MVNRRSLIYNLDWVCICIYLLLCIFGWMNIYSAVYQPKHLGVLTFGTHYGKQLIFIVSTWIIALVILLLDSRLIAAFSLTLYIISLMLLLAALVVGRSVGGHQAWIPIGSFRLQPAEFAKLSTCLLLAKYISSLDRKVQDLKTQATCAIILLLPVGLILLQPDAGSALTFFSLILVLYHEGLSGYILLISAWMIALFVLALVINKYALAGGLTLAVLALTGYFKKNKKLIKVFIIGLLLSLAFIGCVDFVYKCVLQTHQRSRIDVLLGKVSDPRGQGYNVNQSKIAIGSGRWLGKGYLQGTQTKFAFVPEQSTDFIFCTIGEEWGFAGCCFIIALYFSLLLRIVYIAERRGTAFARVYGYGVASILFVHIFINIGMTMGLVPVIGIPLPFISYGGSSLWAFTILLFILLKLDSDRIRRF